MVEQQLPADPTDYFDIDEIDYMMSLIEEFEVEMYRLRVKQELKDMDKSELERSCRDIYGDNWKEQ
jgi:hypothetical protein